MKQPWIKSSSFDLSLFLAPGILPAICVLVFTPFFEAQKFEVSNISWVILILCIDVSHVYSTVYRTYFNSMAAQKYATILKLVPFVCWFIGAVLYAISSLLFWRCLAYLAVFHFIRQQYGFLRIYSRADVIPKWATHFFTVCVYSFTLLPILIWHAQGPKNFNWFVENDFIYFNSKFVELFLNYIFGTICVMYFILEAYLFYQFKSVNLPRMLLLIGTAFSWYVGIVSYNADLTFTFLNVVAHGIPYMALIWIEEKRANENHHKGIIKYFFKQYGVILFVGLIMIFAFFEEALWDSLVWQEHKTLFGWMHYFKPIQNQLILAFLIPLLSLPQTTHYVLDGFIWKQKK